MMEINWTSFRLYDFDGNSDKAIEPLVVGQKNVAVRDNSSSQMKRIGSLEVVLRANFGSMVNNVAGERNHLDNCIGKVIVKILQQRHIAVVEPVSRGIPAAPIRW